MEKQILSVFLYGTVSAWFGTFFRKLHFLLAQTQLMAFFLMTLQLPRILSLLTGKDFILKARWRLTKGTKEDSAQQHFRALAQGGE
jgi:hypothetical protein